jgi:hypothetical protein
MLRAQQAHYAPPSGEDLRATEGGKLVAVANGRLNSAPGRDLRADAGGLVYAGEQGQILAHGGGHIVAGPGGYAGTVAGAIGASDGGGLRADGGTIFGRGTLINPQIVNGGSLRPGDIVDYLAAGPVTAHKGIGTLFVGGDLRVDATSSVVVDVRRAGPQSIIADVLNVSADATLAGNLVVGQFDVDPLLPGDSFSPMVFATRTGAFDAVINATPYPGLSFEQSYGATRLTVTARARGGDANLDAVVNLVDFNILASRFGRTGQDWRAGDFTGDGRVNLLDFNILAANFGLAATGASAPSPGDWGALASAVPEPTSSVMTSLLGALLAQRRRRGRAICTPQR